MTTMAHGCMRQLIIIELVKLLGEDTRACIASMSEPSATTKLAAAAAESAAKQKTKEVHNNNSSKFVNTRRIGIANTTGSPPLSDPP